MTILGDPQDTLGGMVPSYSPAGASSDACFATVRYQDAPAFVGFEDGRLTVVVPSPGNDIAERFSLSASAGETILETDSDGDGLCWIRSEDHLFAAVTVADGPLLAQGTYDACAKLLRLCERLGFGKIYRIWNYVGAINAPNAEGLERYRDFCLGRAKAFEDLQFTQDVMPAATGIGFGAGGVSIFLIAKKALKAVNIENPMQVPAYAYPELYGPKPPAFARATLISPPGEHILYISGTASIRDHRTVGDDIRTQLTVATENVQALVEAAKKHAPELAEGGFDSLKIYVRHAGDAAEIAEHLRTALSVSPERSPVFASEICRSDLLLELEGVYRGKAA